MRVHRKYESNFRDWCVAFGAARDTEGRAQLYVRQTGLRTVSRILSCASGPNQLVIIDECQEMERGHEGRIVTDDVVFVPLLTYRNSFFFCFLPGDRRRHAGGRDRRIERDKKNLCRRYSALRYLLSSPYLHLRFPDCPFSFYTVISILRAEIQSLENSSSIYGRSLLISKF